MSIGPLRCLLGGAEVCRTLKLTTSQAKRAWRRVKSENKPSRLALCRVEQFEFGCM